MSRWNAKFLTCTTILACALAATPLQAQGLFDFLFRRPLPPQPIPQRGPYIEERQRVRPAKPKAAPKKSAPEAAAPPAPEIVEPPPPPYEGDLLKLSQIMGSVSYLQSLCTPSEADIWRQRMDALLEAEAPTPMRRAKLAGAYNQGYKDFALTYRHCTPSAKAAIARYSDSGEQVARTISGRFGE
jgi:uncharacterized protein (TIGR02301 family)